MEIFLTSDTHFSHNQQFVYEPRGFTNVQDMNETIVENWNKIVPYDALIYHLGDMALNNLDDAIKYIKNLNGKIIWLRGNHCTDNKITKILENCPNIHMLGYATMIKFHKFHFYLSHYPSMSANMDDSKKPWQRVYNLCGHSHTQDKWLHWDFGCYHCELDAHNCYPRNIEDILLDIKNHNLDKG